ncbi:MAG: DNA-methyltransferase, partial [Ilumatobacteraceae bacterium]
AVRTFDESIGALLADMQSEGIDLDGLGWSEDELRDIIAAGQVEELEPEDPEDVPEVATVVHSAMGEVYELGPHRLVCGDSTSPESWGALMQGEQAQMVWTDPPYGVSYVGGSGLTIQNDDLSPSELKSFLSDALGLALVHSKVGAAWYVASPAGDLFGVFAQVLSELEVWKHTLVWLKDRFVMGRCDYHYRHEAIFYGWKPGGAHYFIDDRTQDSVHEVKRPGASKEHPTMKPVELIRRHIENSSKPGWLVAEPFGGSGSTLMACAETGRVARLIELDPKYCDVIRRRWTRYAKKNGLDAGSGALEDADVDA